MHTEITKQESVFTSGMLSTREFGQVFRVEPGTVRRAYCTRGNYMGIKPLKLESGRLLWPAAEAQKVIEGRQ